ESYETRSHDDPGPVRAELRLSHSPIGLDGEGSPRREVIAPLFDGIGFVASSQAKDGLDASSKMLKGEGLEPQS
ncbi:MAG TPA: hypothetical protein VM430_16740, partial [Microbacterium sp.]|nr:hypothetical protein [Microbacterium sp.]